MNLVDILKDVPVGTKLYCPIYGTVEFLGVDKGGDYPIKVTKTHGDRCLESFTYDGKLYHDEYSDAECILFPSKENRDWGKFHVYLPVGTRVVLTDNLSNDLRIGTYMGNNKAKFGITLAIMANLKNEIGLRKEEVLCFKWFDWDNIKQSEFVKFLNKEI